MNCDTRTPYAYSSCRTEITRCDAAPETHCVIQLWSEVRLFFLKKKAHDRRVLIRRQQAPAPYVVDAFVSAMDDLCILWIPLPWTAGVGRLPGPLMTCASCKHCPCVWRQRTRSYPRLRHDRDRPPRWVPPRSLT